MFYVPYLASGSTTPNSTTLASNASFRPTSMPPPVPRIDTVTTSGVNKEELILLIQDLQNELATMVRTYSGDKERLKSAIITYEDHQTSQMNKSSTLGMYTLCGKTRNSHSSRKYFVKSTL